MSSNNMNAKDNLFHLLINKFFPYWPLFVGLFVISLLGSFIYLAFTVPQYEIAAALIVNDEKKGVDDSQIMESMNVFNTKKIVENEIEVLHSKDLIYEVVENLHLYAIIGEAGIFSDTPQYQEAPVRIELKEPNNPSNYTIERKIFFKYDEQQNTVLIGDNKYPLDSWSISPNGHDSEIKFVRNEKVKNFESDKEYFYLLKDPKSIATEIYDALYVGASSKLSTVVRITLEDHVPKRGEDILNQLIDSYVNASLKDQNTLAANTLEFVEKRMDDVGKQLKDVEKELEQYRSSEGVVNLSEQGSLYLQNVGDYDRRIADINIQLSVLNKVENYVLSKNKSSGIVPSTLGIDDPILSQLLQSLYEAEIEYEELRKTTATNNPVLVAINNKISKIRPSILENVGSQKANLRASRGSLSSNSGKYNEALQVLPEQERKLVEITRKKKSISELYDFLVQKREETALSFAPSAGDIRVIEEAESSIRPVSPKKPFVYLTALLASFALGLFWVARKELFTSNVLFRSEIENYTKLPILGELAYLDKDKSELRIDEHKDIFIMDQFRQILSYLGLYGQSDSAQKIMVTSSITGEGKSYVSANLALTMSSTGRKTALIDMDLRNAEISSIFALEDELGISEHLSGKASYDSIVNLAGNTSLRVFPSGKKAMNSSELLANENLGKFFKQLEDNFDCIIIDTPPITMVSDAAILSGFCDKTLLVVRHDYTPKFMIKHIDENLRLKGLKDCSIVFNGVKHRGIIKQKYGYGYGYGYEPEIEEEAKFWFPGFIKSLMDKFRKQLVG